MKGSLLSNANPKKLGGFKCDFVLERIFPADTSASDETVTNREQVLSLFMPRSEYLRCEIYRI